MDDDAVNLNVLTQTLETEGYVIDAATSPEQALAEIKRQRYDLVITDVMMPHMSGYELTELIRERFNLSELPILLLTARVRTEDILTGFRAGANDYVKKPVDAWELKARVQALTQLKTSIDDRLRMESAWLQSQIQPHFLFNTLNSIAALGMIDFNKMQTLLDEFSNYLRLSFDFKNASPLVPLEHELSLVRSYVYIEKERFGSRLTVEWNIESGIDILIPPLSIQPLVENAIKHGLLSRNRGGTVSVNVRRLSEIVDISIVDDGDGMDKDYLSQLLTHSNRSSSRSGIGLININRRLMQQFGKSLDIQSSLEQGTRVSFQIPYQDQ
ncbi:Sensor histidine kinase YpdA [compost metagenome]